MFCHNCGQQVTNKIFTVKGLISEYMNNAFIWDSKCLQTIWTLVRRPGSLTSEYLAGKYVSQEHPLKLNMFLLFLLVTLFLIFSGTEKVGNSVHSLTTDERWLPGIQMELMLDDQEYALKLRDCPRDTVLMLAPLFLADGYPEIIQNLETIVDTDGESLDTWRAIVPRIFIDDKIIVPDSNGQYIFNDEIRIDNDALNIFNKIWTEMVNFLSKYLPLIVLFTAPFLTLSLKFVQRKTRLKHITHFIFALHYTAFLELLMLCIYLLHLIFAVPHELLECIIAIGSCVYLTLAFHHVYKTDSWLKAIAKALVTNIIYILICTMMFIIIFLAVSVYVAITLL
jgi:hypothetical protein